MGTRICGCIPIQQNGADLCGGGLFHNPSAGTHCLPISFESKLYQDGGLRNYMYLALLIPPSDSLSFLRCDRGQQAWWEHPQEPQLPILSRSGRSRANCLGRCPPLRQTQRRLLRHLLAKPVMICKNRCSCEESLFQGSSNWQVHAC